MSGRDHPARLVVRAPNWLGDAVMAIPAMAALRVGFPESHLTIAAPASLAPLFNEHTPVVPDAVLALAGGRGDIDLIRRASFDACVLLPNSFRSAWDVRRAGVRERWGYRSSGRGWMLTRGVKKRGRRETVHQAEYYRALVRALGVSCGDEPPRISATSSSIERADALLHQHRWPSDARYFAVMPGAAYGQAKQWPADRMAETAARLVRQRGMRCIVMGAASDRPAARAIESWLREHTPIEAPLVLDLTGQTSLGALIGLLSRAELCVSNDSGGMHLAAALGRPVVAIFGPTDERVTRPLGDQAVITESVFCRPCMLRDCPIDHRCMKRITVDRVVEAATSRLSAAGVV
jgi:heptosyltransferase II